MRGCLPMMVAVFSLIFTAAACRDSDAPVAFNTDLSTDPNARLLPTLTVYHAAHDVSITQGNTRATIVKLDEFDPANVPVAPEAIAAAVTPDLAPAEGIADALGKVGGAFLGNLLGGQAPPSGGDQSASGATATPPAGSASAAPGDADAILQAHLTALKLLTAFNQARADRTFADLPSMSVAAQRSVAEDYYDKLEELSTSFTNLLTSYDKVQAGTMAKMTGQLAQAMSPLELSALSASDTDTITGQLAGGSVTFRREGGAWKLEDVTFRREGGAWKLEDPFLPAAGDWPGVERDLNDAIDALDSLDDDLLSGTTVTPATADQAFTRAIALMAGA